MGEGFLPSAEGAKAITTSLNKLFQSDFDATKDNFDALNKIYNNQLLAFDSKAAGNSRRQRSLRYTAWLLTSDVDFKDNKHPYPAKSFKAFLRWLTWVERHAPKDSAVWVDGGFSNEQPAEAIIQTIYQALQKKGNQVHFDWVQAADNEPSLLVAVTRTGSYRVAVKSRSEEDLKPITDSEDDDF